VGELDVVVHYLVEVFSLNGEEERGSSRWGGRVSGGISVVWVCMSFVASLFSDDPSSREYILLFLLAVRCRRGTAHPLLLMPLSWLLGRNGAEGIARYQVR
jgi:hypothetical protein